MTHSPSSAQSDLLPCPFCGGTDFRIETADVQPDNYWSGFVQCTTCDACGPEPDEWLGSDGQAEQAAREFWNRRAAASAHTIGEDAANVAIGEREAALMCERLRSMGLNTCNEAAALIECLARAALTAEKVAGIQPLTVSPAPTSQYAEGWNDCLKEANSPMTNGDFHCPACGEVMKGPTACGSCLWEADTCGYTAPQQPAQPVAQTLALTDEQIEDLQEAREILENMVRSVELDGNYSTEATCTFLRQALLCLPAAQPASSLAEGGERADQA